MSASHSSGRAGVSHLLVRGKGPFSDGLLELLGGFSPVSGVRRSEEVVKGGHNVSVDLRNETLADFDSR